MSKEPLSSISKTARISTIIERLLRNNKYFGMPSFVQIEVTNKCNLRCKYCLRTRYQPDENNDMSFDLFKSIILQLKGRTPSIMLVGLGEPLLNPQIFSMISFVKENNFEISLIDNFTLMNQEKSVAVINSGLDFLYVSFDNVTKQDFEERRTGACFETVVDNIKLFIKTRNELKSKKPVLLFKSTIAPDNFSEIPKLIKFAEDIGAEGVNFGKMRGIDEKKYLRLPTLSKDQFLSNKIVVDLCELRDSYECDATRGCYVTYDGKVLRCGLMAELLPRKYYFKVQLGDVTKEPIGKIWCSKRFRELRKKLESGLFSPECATCGGNRNRSK